MNSMLLIKLFLLIQTSFALQEGDLLFQDSDCGPFCDAIEKVTTGYQNSNLSHVGMVIKTDDGSLQVIEAITAGVVTTPISEFMSRSYDANGNSKVIVGRLKSDHHHLIPQACKEAQLLIGKSYDDIFDINNDQYYCSELVYTAYQKANDDKPIFKLFPMTFIDPDTKSTFGIWTDYYKELGQEIPEGKAGLNPGGISRSEYIDIIYEYGKVSGRK